VDSKLRRGVGEVAAVPVHSGLEESKLESLHGILQGYAPGKQSIGKASQRVAKLA
jgi:hypothetical protein